MTFPLQTFVTHEPIVNFHFIACNAIICMPRNQLVAHQIVTFNANCTGYAIRDPLKGMWIRETDCAGIVQPSRGRIVFHNGLNFLVVGLPIFLEKIVGICLSWRVWIRFIE